MWNVIADFNRMEQVLLQRASGLHAIVKRESGAAGTFTIQRDLRSALLRVQTPGSAGNDRTDHSYHVVGNTLRGVDNLNGEWLSRTTKLGSGPVERLGRTLGELDEGVRLIANPADTRDFTKRLRAQKGWRSTKMTDRTRYEVGAAGSRIRLEISRSSALPLRVEFDLGASAVAWSYQYPRAQRIVPPTVTGRDRVDSFIARPALPRFASSALEQKVRAVLSVHRKFNRGRVSFSTGESLSLYAGALGEKQGNESWQFADGQLSILGRAGAFRGPAKRAEVQQHLAANGISSLSTYARDLLNGRAPFRYELTSDLTARKLGQIAVSGRTFELIEFRGSSRRFVWQVDTVTKRIGRIESEVYGSSGAVAVKRSLSITYTPLTALLALKLPAGRAWRALPALD